MDWLMYYRDRAALDGFFAELRQVWTLAGPPSYQDFEKLSMKVKGPAGADGEWLPRSTTQDILSGRRRQPPKWRWVARFIMVLRVAAEQAGVNPDKLGTLAEWKQKHEAVRAALAASREFALAAGGDGALTAGLTTSAECDPEWVRDPELAALLRTVGQDWWHEYRDLVPDWFGAYLSLEPAASLIRAYETMLVPGWLQTEAYAETAIRLSWITLNPAAVSRLVEFRMRRRQILARPDAPKLWVIIDETAVRRRLGSANTMRAQISHLIRVSQQRNITVQVVPLETSVHALAGGPITFLRFPRSDMRDVVYLEQLTGALYLPRQGDVSHYMSVLSGLAIEALSPAETTDFLREVLLDI
jgi:hypothetical protein